MPVVNHIAEFHFSTGKGAAVKLTPEQVRQIFLKCDKDGNNLLSWNELKNAFEKLGALLPWFRASRGLHRADANRNGLIDSEELGALVNYACSLGYTIT